MKKVALIGCGALGGIVSRHFALAGADSWSLEVMMARTPTHAEALAAEVGARAVASLDELLAEKPDLVIETAGIGAVKEYAEQVLACGADFLMVSVGALADKAFYDKLAETARRSGAHLYIANGAIGGFDAMRTYCLMGADEVTITSTKAPKSLRGAPGLAGRELSETEDEAVFEGSMEEAIRGFPKNVNVGVATAVVTERADTTVRIVSRPTAVENGHFITIKGPRLRAHMEFCSEPDPNNPRSSTSTAYSVLAFLKNLASPVVFF